MESIHSHEFQIRDLNTRSVTLFPNRAQVVRQIKAELKPGSNQITVVGLTPSTDEHSIKVEGTGSAIITNFTIESLPNQESFQNVYPDLEESDTESQSDQEDDEITDSEDQAIKDMSKRMASLLDEKRRAKETVTSAESRMKILDSYMMNCLPSSEDADSKLEGFDIASGLDTYRVEREKIHEAYMEGNSKQREIDDQIEKLSRETSRLQKRADKAKAKAEKQKAKAKRARDMEKQKAAQKHDELAKERARIRREREIFWPKNVYVVKVNLETADFTPASSRRSSISSDLVMLATKTGEPINEDDTATTTCDLVLSYTTSYAYWSPTYDLALSTTTNSGTLCFDAKLTNKTSETWSNCKVTLSTSQADFTRLNDRIPTLVPWRIRLADKNIQGLFGQPWGDVMYSREEQSYKPGHSAGNPHVSDRPHAQLFGLNSSWNTFGNQTTMTSQPPNMASSTAFGSSTVKTTANTAGGLFGNIQSSPHNTTANTAGGLFGNNQSSLHNNTANTGGGIFGSIRNSLQNTTSSSLSPFGNTQAVRTAPIASPWASGFGAASSSTTTVEEQKKHSNDGVSPSQGEGGTLVADPKPDLEFQEFAFDETGLTSTWDLSGVKTLQPSSTASKQRVARVNFTSVTFSHTVVPKYKPAAYLKAKLRNGSKLTLLKGPAGLTLDGSFMGRTNLPRCSTGDSFDINLGVDPAIKITYPRPDVKRGQSGFLSKEDSSTYSRLVTISNTRSVEKGKPVQVTVLDQIPISEDDKLRVDILQPKGLLSENSEVSTGTPGEDGNEYEDWGKAVAKLKADGEITWDVKLNAGCSVKLGLGYELSVPAGEHATNV